MTRTPAQLLEDMGQFGTSIYPSNRFGSGTQFEYKPIVSFPLALLLRRSCLLLHQPRSGLTDSATWQYLYRTLSLGFFSLPLAWKVIQPYNIEFR